MRTPVLLLLALTLGQSCRTSRDTVEIQDRNAPPNPPSDDYLNVGRSVQTTFTISAISLPTGGRSFEYLNLELRRSGEGSEAYSRKRYQQGDPITIEPNVEYDVVVTAMRGATELFSTRFCSQPQNFRAEKGPNLFTASLCAKPETP